MICFCGLGTGYLLRGLGFATVSSSLRMKEDFFGLCYYLLQHFLERLLEMKLVLWKTYIFLKKNVTSVLFSLEEKAKYLSLVSLKQNFSLCWTVQKHLPLLLISWADLMPHKRSSWGVCCLSPLWGLVLVYNTLTACSLVLHRASIMGDQIPGIWHGTPQTHLRSNISGCKSSHWYHIKRREFSFQRMVWNINSAATPNIF